MKEDRRVSLTTKGNKKVMLLTQLIALTGSQEQKLNCESLLPELEKIAKELEIDWAVELSANIEYGTLAVSRTYDSEIGNFEFSSIEKAAKDFLSAVDKLELRKSESDCTSHEDSKEMSAIDFVKALLFDLELPENHKEHVVGAQILCCGPNTAKNPLVLTATCPILLPWGKMSHDLLQEMCKLYLAAHEND